MLEDVDQLDLEDQHAVGRDGSAALVAVAERGRDIERPLVARAHQLQRLDPAGDQPFQGEGRRRPALVRRIEHLARDQLALVVDLDLVGEARVRAGGGAGALHLVLQAGGQDDHAPLLGVLGHIGARRRQVVGGLLGRAAGGQSRAEGEGEEQRAHEGLLDRARRIAPLAQGVHDFLGVLGVAGLDHHVELRALGRHVEGQAVVGHLDDVAAQLADGVRHGGQQARAIVADDAQRHQPLGADQFAGQHRGQQARVDVAAGDDQAALLAAEAFGIGEQGGQCPRPGAFGHGLLDVAQQGDPALEIGLLDQQHVLDQGAHDRIGQVADLLDGDALGDGLAAALGGHAAHAGGERGVHGRLDAEDADLGVQGLGGGGHARDQAAAAYRHGQDLEVGHVLEHLQRHRALAGHDVEVVEGVDEGQALRLAQPQGVGVGVVIGVAVDDDVGAVVAGVLDLHERRAARHDDGGRHAQARGVIGQPLRMVAGRGGDDAAPALVLGQQQQLVQRAALLIGGGELQVLELEPHLRPGDLRQRARIAAGRALDMAGQPLGGGPDGVEGQGHAGKNRSGKSAGKLTARRPRSKGPSSPVRPRNQRKARMMSYRRIALPGSAENRPNGSRSAVSRML